MMEELPEYFPWLTVAQKKQFAAMPELYAYWNERINVISRQDMPNFVERHVLHSLAIAEVCRFGAGVKAMDVGTGGGFPGIPLAVMFPDSEFTLVDSIAKKIKVVEEIASALGLKNVRAKCCRAESVEGRFDFVVSRAVTETKTLVEWVWNKIERRERYGQGGDLSNGILCLKGGDLKDELAAVKKPSVVYNISDFFGEEFFATKKIVYIPK